MSGFCSAAQSRNDDRNSCGTHLHEKVKTISVAVTTGFGILDEFSGQLSHQVPNQGNHSHTCSHIISWVRWDHIGIDGVKFGEKMNLLSIVYRMIWYQSALKFIQVAGYPATPPLMTDHAPHANLVGSGAVGASDSMLSGTAGQVNPPPLRNDCFDDS